jgi:hypothetical protein
MKKLKIKNPERLDSTNHCLSNNIIRIQFETETVKEYRFLADVNYKETYPITISKNITDNNVFIVFDGNRPYRKSIDFVKNRNTILDWMVVSVEQIDNERLPF